jgi:hypothetical protein
MRTDGREVANIAPILQISLINELKNSNSTSLFIKTAAYYSSHH